MKKLIVLAMLLIFTGVSHAVSVEVCTLTFTNITTTGSTATSATASGNSKCTENSANGYAIDTHGARSIQIDKDTDDVNHTATSWDMNVTVSNAVGGTYKLFWEDTGLGQNLLESDAVTEGMNYIKITVDENAATRVDATITVTVTKD